MEYVLGFAFQGSIVYLIEKTHPASQKGMLNGIGGKIEKGETPNVAMEREFREETGVVVPANSWVPFCVLEGFPRPLAAQWKVWCFKANLPFGIARPSTCGEEKVVAVSSSHLPNKVIPNLRYLIPMARMPFNIQAQVLEGSAFG